MYVSDEIDTMDKTTFDGFPFIFARRWVSTKGKDITTAMLLRFLHHYPEFQRRENQVVERNLLQGRCRPFLVACWCTSSACMSRYQGGPDTSLPSRM